MTSVLALLLSLLLSLALTGAFLLVLFFVVRAAVEGGIRRALPDTLLRPSVRQILGQDDVR